MTYSELQKKGQVLTEAEIKKVETRLKSDLLVARNNIQAKLKSLYDRNLNNLPKDDWYNYINQRNRLESLLSYVTEQYNSANIPLTTTQASKISLSNEFYRQQYATNTIANQLGINYPFSELNQNVYRVSIYGEFVKDYENFAPKYGGTLKEILAKNKTQDLQRIRQAVVSGIYAGDSYTNTAKSVKDAFDGSYNSALRVIRTESHRNMEAGNYENANQAKEAGVNIVRKISSVLDTRTRAQSASMDGQEENEDGLFIYPNGATSAFPGNSGVSEYDINDRETTIDTIDGKDPELRRVRNPNTGKSEIVSFTQFDEWAKANGLKQNAYGEYYKRKGE